MNKLQTFLATLPNGFFPKTAQVSELVKLDRLFPLLVRCGGCRFTCPAQDIEHLRQCVVAGGDYVRDVSLPVGWEARAASWVDSCPVTPAASLPASFLAPRATPPARSSVRSLPGPAFNENDCGGVWTGSGVVSDADPGL